MMRPRRPSSGRRSRRKTRYLSAKYQRRKRDALRGGRAAASAAGLPSPSGGGGGLLAGNVGVAIAFGAGLASFLSPCVLPLIPSYITFITGMTLDDVPRARRLAFIHALLFVFGFSLIFLALGASATLLGRLLVTYRVWVSRVGGLLVLAFGLYLLGIFKLDV